MKALNGCLHAAALLLGAVFLAASHPLGAAEGDDKGAFPLEGTWRWNFTMPDGTVVRPKLKLTTEQGVITGTASFRPGSETAVTNALINGDQFTFQVRRQREGQDVLTTYTGQWTSNAIKGKIESNWAGEKQTYDWDAQRAHIGVEGIWRWTNSFFRGFGGFGGRGPGGREAAADRTADAASQGGREERAPADRGQGGGRGPGGRGPGGPGGRGPGGGRGGRGFETRVELEQVGSKLTGKTVGRFGRQVAITNAFFTNGVVYFEIERFFFDNRSLTKYQGKQTGDVIQGTMESEIEGEERTIDWEATRVD